jgi:two-component SAPR family response regulator
MRREKFQVSSNYKILLVDDEQGIVDSLSVVLKRSGYHYTGLTNPLEAWYSAVLLLNLVKPIPYITEEAILQMVPMEYILEASILKEQSWET